MNRKERRALARRGPGSGGPLPARAKDADTPELMAQARQLYDQHLYEAAQRLCERIVGRDPAHVAARNLLGLMLQNAGQHRRAIKEFKRAIAADELDAACHYNLASSYQALQRGSEAEAHFKRAIALGLSRRNIEEFIFLNPAAAACATRLAEPPVRPGAREILDDGDLHIIAGDMFLRAALCSILLASVRLETFLTALRATLLKLAYAAITKGAELDHQLVGLLCALAQQCFINEYVFAQSETEAAAAAALREELGRRAGDGAPIPPLLLAAVAAYGPLHALAAARTLAGRDWPAIAADLVRQQLIEPLQEADDIPAIPALTPVADDVSFRVMEQYAQNPYPRWTVNPMLGLIANWNWPDASAGGEIDDILIAGCGTGQHVFHVKHNFPKARVLAIDISRPSLAFARRKVREAGLADVEFAQADILSLGTIGRRFDLIEAVGVLHHLADPERGWRVLLSLLRQGGEMRVGLYSERARRDLAAVRAFIAERGYRPSLEDIRRSRQDILRDTDERRRDAALRPRDFYSASGCRDLLFHVMEHTFTIARIKRFLDEEGLTFLGFDLDRETAEKFASRFPGKDALFDLDLWDSFEADHPDTFRLMYQFMVRRS